MTGARHYFGDVGGAPARGGERDKVRQLSKSPVGTCITVSGIDRKRLGRYCGEFMFPGAWRVESVGGAYVVTKIAEIG